MQLKVRDRERERQWVQERQRAKPSPSEVFKQTEKKNGKYKKMSQPPAINFHSFPRSLSRCVLQHQRQLFWVFILFFFFVRLCCLSPLAKFLKVSHASWVFNEFGLCGPRISALSLFFFHFWCRHAPFYILTCCKCVRMCVCNSVRKEYLHLQFVLTAPRKIFRTLYTSTKLHHPLRPLYCSNFFSLCIVSSICCAFRLLATCRSGWRNTVWGEERNQCMSVCLWDGNIFYWRWAG